MNNANLTRVLPLIFGLLYVLVACSNPNAAEKLRALPVGVPQNGAQIFSQGAGGAVACTACHSLDGMPMSAPTLQNYGKIAPQRTSLSAEEYTYLSIVRPSQHVVSGYANLMPTDYEQKLSAQQLADLIAFLLSL